MNYQVILADPPWAYKRSSGRGAARNHYEDMTVQQICEMRPQIDQWAADDCALFLWSTFPTIHTHGLVVMEAWGFTYKTAGFVWVKVSNRTGKPVIGPGQYTRSNAEPCLVGIRGKPKRKELGVPQIIIAPRAGHSVKPAAQYNRIERLYDGPYLELFARRPVEGWDVWGDEVAQNDDDVIADSEPESLPNVQSR